MIVRNDGLPTATLPGSFARPFMPHAETDIARGKYYRPLVNLSFLLDYRLGGLTPRGYHLHNVLLHVAVSLLFTLLLWLLFPRPWLTLLTGLAFALYPIHVESVAFIAARTDLILTLLALTGIITFVRWRCTGHWPWLVATGAAYFLALLAKEAALLLPLVLLIPPTNTKPEHETRKTLLALLPALIAYLVLRSIALHGSLPVVNRMALGRYPVMILNILGTYVGMLAFPFDERVLYAQHPAILNLSGLTILGGLLLALPLPLLLIRRQKAALLLGWLLLVATLLPVTNVLSLGVAYAAQRLAYLPSAGFLLLVAALAAEFAARSRPARYAILGLAFVCLGVMPFNIVQRLPTWRNQVNLFRAMVRVEPDVATARANLGTVLLNDLQRPDSAAVHLRRAVQLNPSLTNAHVQLARALKDLRDTTGAIREYQQAVLLDSADFETRNNLGQLWGRKGNLDSAAFHLQSAARLNPMSPEILNNLGIAYALAGRNKEALSEFRRALTLNPGLPETNRNLGTLFHTLGQPDSARYYLSRTRSSNP